ASAVKANAAKRRPKRPAVKASVARASAARRPNRQHRGGRSLRRASMMATAAAVHGAGLGLRRALLAPLSERRGTVADFLEVAPENWMRIGGRLGRQFRALTERYAFTTHGL